MLPGDRLICVFVEPLPLGTRFKDWLVHVTVVPWFRVSLSSADLAEELRREFRALSPFEAIAGTVEQFGHSRSRQASLIEPAKTFAQIEERVRRALKSHDAWLVDETTKRRRPYRPHVTYQKSGHLNSGDSFHCEAVYIVEQKGDYKQIVDKVELGNDKTAA